MNRKIMKLVFMTLAILVVVMITMVVSPWKYLSSRKRYVVEKPKILVTIPRNQTDKVRDKTINVGEVNPRSRIIFYNPVGKCGSRSLLHVVHQLSKENHFHYAWSTDYSHEHAGYDEAAKEALKISQFKPPTFYSRYIHFIDFEMFGYQKPIYINMIRNPIDRFVSHYNYHKYGDGVSSFGIEERREHKHNINECIKQDLKHCNDSLMNFYTGMFFCGMHPTCVVDSVDRISLAKKHLDEEYTFVGMLEEFDTTLKLLEIMFPEYFSGALQAWKRNQQSKIATATKKLDVLNEESISKLQKTLAGELEVYNLAKKKFDTLKKKFSLE